MKTILLFFALFISLHSSAQTFIKDLGNIKYDDGATCISKSEKGFLIAGYIERSAYISEVDYNGKVLWKDIYHISDQQDLITDMKYIDGKIIACGFGYYEGTGNFLEFYFKYDIASKSFDWIKKSKLALKPATIQTLPNGNYLITGDEIYIEEFKTFLMEIEAKSGKMIHYSAYNFTGNESASTSVIYKNNIYLGGRYALEKRKIDKYRGAISKYDLNFNEIWSNYYLHGKDKFLRNYLNKLIIDDGNILSIFRTNNHGINNYYTATFTKTNLEGELLWAKEFSLEGFVNINVKDIKASNDAYYIYGSTLAPTEDFFIIKTDKEGDVLWAKTYGEESSDNIQTDQGNFLELTDEHLFIIGQSKSIASSSKYNSILMKLNLDGTFDMDCWGKNIDIKTNEFTDLVQGGISLNRNDSIFKNGNLSYKQEKKYLEQKKYPYFCFPKLVINDYDTLKNESIITIDFLANDIIPKDDKVSHKIISSAKNGEVIIENNQFVYTQKDALKCGVDSFKYQLFSETNGIDTATVYIYTLKTLKGIKNVNNAIMPDNNTLVLKANANSESFKNAKYFWSNGEKTSNITIKNAGEYTVNIENENCLYQKQFNIKENPYSFKNIAKTNITFMLDVSISMNREHRLPVLKNALYKILNFMRDEDKISIINYSDNAEIIFDGVKATETAVIKAKIDDLNSKGTSDIIEGLKLALKTFNNNYTEGGNNKIIFTTDGDISNEKREKMIQFIQKEIPEKVSFSLFLFNDASIFKTQMQEVSKAQNGTFYIITPENIEEVLLKEFKSVRLKK